MSTVVDHLPWRVCSCPSCGLEVGGSPVLDASSCHIISTASDTRNMSYYRFSPAPLMVGMVRTDRERSGVAVVEI